MKRITKVRPAALPFNVTIEVTKTDYAQYKRDHEKRVVMPGETVVDEALENDSIWKQFVAESILIETGQHVIYIEGLAHREQADTYLFSAACYMVPAVTFKPDLKAVLEGLYEKFKVAHYADPRMVQEQISQLRKLKQFDLNRCKRITDDVPLAWNDVILVEMHNEVSKQEARLPLKQVVRLNEVCPDELREVLLGKLTGDTVVASIKMRDQTTLMHNVRQRINIICKLAVPDMDEADFLRVCNVASHEALQVKVKEELDVQIDQAFQQAFDIFLMENTEVAPIPATLLWDRASGYVDYLIGRNGQKAVFENLGVRTLQAAVEVALPVIQIEFQREDVCVSLADALGIRVTDRDVKDFLDQNNMIETFDTRIVAMMDVAYKKVREYYRHGCRDLRTCQICGKDDCSGHAEQQIAIPANATPEQVQAEFERIKQRADAQGKPCSYCGDPNHEAADCKHAKHLADTHVPPSERPDYN